MRVQIKYLFSIIYLLGALHHAAAQADKMTVLNWYDSLTFPTSDLFTGATYQKPQTSYGNPFFKIAHESVKLIAYKGELRESDLMIDIYNFKVIVPVINRSSYSYIILANHNIDSICIGDQVYFYNDQIDENPRLAQKVYAGDSLILYKTHYKKPKLTRVDTYQLAYYSEYILSYNELYFKISNMRDYQRILKEQKQSIKRLIDNGLLEFSNDENHMFLLKQIEKLL